MDKIVIDRAVSKKADEFAEREYVSGADEREWLSKGYYWGYKDAEKELSLTWEDIKMIVNIADDMVDLDIRDELPECCKTEEGYYTEVLRKYDKKSRDL